jgi:hypothetical protein
MDSKDKKAIYKRYELYCIKKRGELSPVSPVSEISQVEKNNQLVREVIEILLGEDLEVQ